MARSPLAGSRAALRRIYRWLVETFTVSEAFVELELAVPDTRTTVIRGDVGWPSRPPARLACPECDAEIHQHRATNAIDCPECWAGYDPSSFAELELLALTCPRCERPMAHGVRHPRVVDVPQWATCEDCGYHWEFAHHYRT